MTHTHPHFLIVGQGLAGSWLAYRLIQSGQHVVILDVDLPGASSKVAAGLIDPFSGRRFVKALHSDVLLPFAKTAYTEVENHLNCRVYYPKPSVRLHAHADERKAWERKRCWPELSPYFGHDMGDFPGFHAPFGGVEVKEAGYVHVSVFLKAMADFFMALGCLIQRPFCEKDVLHAERVIFCEGHRGKENLFFKHLPFSNVKGDILTVDHKAQLPDTLVHKGKWILPLSPTRFKTGASYIRDYVDFEPSLAGRTDICTFLSDTLDLPASGYHVAAHEAGVRPILSDNRPVLGFLSEHPNIGIFNGLGSRGVLQAPYYAEKLTRHCIDRSSLELDIHISRFRCA